MATTSFKLTSSDEVHSWPRRRKTAKPFRTGSVRSEIDGYNEDIEIIQHLKKKRSRALASLTRKRNDVTKLLIDDVDKLPLVNDKMEEYTLAFQKFCKANDAYDNVINDGESKAESFIYFVEVKRKFLEFCQTVTTWVTDMEAKLENLIPQHGPATPSEVSASSSFV